MIVSDEDPAGDWTAPGVYRTDPGVYRIPLPLPNDGLRAVNVYALLHADELVLIDSGWALAAARERLEAALGAIGAGVRDVRRFLVTHIHRDHYTLATVLRREFGGRIALGRGEQPSMADIHTPGRPAFGAQLSRLTRAGADELVQRLRAQAADTGERELYGPPDDWLDDGTAVDLRGRSLSAVATPGHTRGHVVYRDGAAGLLFAGDHVLPHITPSIGFEPVPAEQPLGDYLSSLRLVRALPDTRLLPAHGPPTGSVHARVDELLAHHDDRLRVMLAAVADGTGTAGDAAARVVWTRRGRRFGELDLFNQMLAVLETLAHLDLLVRQGRLAVCERDGVAYYTPTGAPGGAAGTGPAH